MKFLIQTFENHIQFDFAFELINVLKSYNEWHSDDKIVYDFCEGFNFPNINNPKEYCPIGSVEFVSKYIEFFFGKEYIPKPKNIPIELCKYNFTKRFTEIINITDDLKIKSKDYFQITLFAKDINVIKSSNNGKYYNGYQNIPNGTYQITSYLDNIISEYRCFIFENELLDIRNYNGSFQVLPDFKLIKQMIDEYAIKAPKSYTLDVGILDNKETCIIEIHDFFSCGLYGFKEVNRLPYMFWRWWFFDFLIKNNI